MIFPDKRLLLAAALGLPVMLAGCQSRAELLTSTAVDSPTRTVTAESANADPAESETTDEQSSDAVAAQSASDQQTSTPSSSPEAMPRSILESAGAVVEFDEQQRAVGIDLTEAHITPDVTRSIGELTDLQWVDLRGTRITDTDLAIICALPQFELMALGQTHITDAGLKHLRQQQKLRFLSLDGTAVTDAGLQVLAGLPRLEGLSLANTSVSKSAARDFEKRQPGCRVILDSDASEAAPPQQPTKTSLEPIDWDVPAAQPQQKPTEQSRAAEPAPGEPTSAATQDATWFLDATQPTVFPQPFPDTSIAAQTPAAASALPQLASTPDEQVAAGPQRIEITPVPETSDASVPAQITASGSEETAQHLHHVLQQRLLDPEVLTALSRHLLAQHEYAKAARALEALAALTPDDPQVRFDLGATLARSGEYDRAHPQLASVVGDATAWYNLGVIAYERKELLHSERYFGRAIDLAPDFREARDWLNRVRESSASIDPTAQTPASVGGQDLVDLLMSEFGTVGSDTPVGATPAPNRSAAGILIVPAK